MRHIYKNNHAFSSLAVTLTILVLFLIAAGVLFITSTKQNQSPILPPPSLTPNPSPALQTISVYFATSTANCNSVVPVSRTITPTKGVAQAALNELFNGPTAEEKQAGYTSPFSTKTATILQNISIQNGTAYVDLSDIRKIIPNVSSSCGSGEFFSQTQATLKQFSTIKRVIFAINGDPMPFYEFMQIGCTQDNDYCNPMPFAAFMQTYGAIYTSPSGFSVTYPSNIFTHSLQQIHDPAEGGDTMHQAMVLTHSSPIKHCGLSGLPQHCTANTQNMTIIFMPISLPYDALQQKAQSLYGGVAPTTIDGHDGFTFSMGAEGEGATYAYAPINASSTLMIAWTHIDESIESNYQTAPDFIPYAQQQRLADSVVASITFQ